MNLVIQWAAIKTEYQRLDGLYNKHLFPTLLKSKKFKIKVTADSASGEGHFQVHRQHLFFIL